LFRLLGRLPVPGLVFRYLTASVIDTDVLGVYQRLGSALARLLCLGLISGNS
jgi:hypothetical protein